MACKLRGMSSTIASRCMNGRSVGLKEPSVSQAELVCSSVSHVRLYLRRSMSFRSFFLIVLRTLSFNSLRKSSRAHHMCYTGTCLNNTTCLLPTSSHLFPPLPTSSHLFPPLPTSSHLFPPPPTSSHLFPHLPTTPSPSLPATAPSKTHTNPTYQKQQARKSRVRSKPCMKTTSDVLRKFASLKSGCALRLHVRRTP
jgi:hypothetical protein